MTTFLQDRVFSKKISLHEHVPLNKRLTFAKKSSNEKPTEDLKMRATEMEQNALRAVINLVEDSQLVNFSELLNIMLLTNVWPSSIAMVPTEKLSLFKNSSFNQYLYRNLR